MTARRSLRAFCVLTAMAGAVAPAAAAEPVSLGTLPEDSPVALAGDSVLVVRERRREFAVTSLPSGRAVARFPLVAGGPGFVQVAASATTATLVVVEPFGRRRFGAAQVLRRAARRPVRPARPEAARPARRVPALRRRGRRRPDPPGRGP